jgi:hypothetical protein
LPLGRDGQLRIPSPSQQCKRGQRAGAPGPEALYFLSVLIAICSRLNGAFDLIIDNAPAWPSNVATLMRPSAMRLLSIPARSCAAITCIPCFVAARACRSSFCSHERALHEAPFARPLLAWAIHLSHIRPRVIRLDAAYWGLRLIAWIHAMLGAVAVVPWNRHPPIEPLLPPTWTKEELGLPQQHQALLWPRLPFLSSATSAAARLGSHRSAGRVDLHRSHHRRFGCPTG